MMMWPEVWLAPGILYDALLGFKQSGSDLDTYSGCSALTHLDTHISIVYEQHQCEFNGA